MFTFSAENHKMTKEDFNDLVVRLKSGDNSALSYLHPLQDGCIRMLVVKSSRRCDQDLAYDLFVDSVLDFHANVLLDKVEFQNIQAYLRRICWNKWLAFVRNTERKDKKQDMVTSQLYDRANDLNTEEMEDLFKAQLSQLEQAMQQLNDQCRKVLYMAIAEERPMAEIAAQLKMASSDVAKTTKSRCYKKLMELIRKAQADD